MEKPGLHPIDECLSEDWLEAWAADVIRDVEAYLAKYAAFHACLTEQERQQRSA